MSKWGNGWNDTDEYSTSEVKTNKIWIDGKPIYRKIVSSAGSVSSSFFRVTEIGELPNVDTYVKIYATITHSNGVVDVGTSGNYFFTSGAYYHFYSPFTVEPGNAIVTFEYTKTTD